MTHGSDDVFDHRVLSNEELGKTVRMLRDESKWTQATLAELSGVTERTVQRVEQGKGASYDTRRALARGFGFDDIDIFNNPIPVLNSEKYQQYLSELERSTVVIDMSFVISASEVRKLVEGADSSVSDQIGEPPADARQAFAGLVDNLRDYNDVRELYGEVQKLEFDEFLETFLQEVKANGCGVAVGERRAKLVFANDPPGKAPMNWRNVYFVVARRDELPSKIRVPKKVELGL